MHPVTAISVLAFALSVLTGPRGASALPTGWDVFKRTLLQTDPDPFSKPPPPKFPECVQALEKQGLRGRELMNKAVEQCRGPP